MQSVKGLLAVERYGGENVTDDSALIEHIWVRFR